MTTSITVTACCDSETTKVRVIQGHRDSGDGVESFLENGESADFHVYDTFYITVDEIPKE